MPDTNSMPSGNQIAVNLAILNDGSYIAVRAKNISGVAFDFDIYLQHYDASGAMIGADLLVNTTTIGTQSQPCVVRLDDGGFVVAWKTANVSASQYGIVFQIFDASGIKVGGEIAVDTGLYTDIAFPYACALPGDGFALSWGHNNGGIYYDTYTQVFTAAGATASPQTLVSANLSSNQIKGQVTSLADGSYIVAWTGYQVSVTPNNEVLEDYDVFARRFTAGGAPIGEEIQVNTPQSGQQRISDIVTLAGGGFVISWIGDLGDGSSGVFFQRFDAHGAKVGGEIQASNQPVTPFTDSTAVALDDGGFFVTWWGSDNALYGQRFDRQGHELGDVVPLQTTSASTTRWQPLVAHLGDGYVLTWQSTATVDGIHHIYGTAEADVLYVGAGDGVMSGYSGDDVYFIRNSGKQVIEAAGEGVDEVRAEISYALADNVENLALIGTAAIDGTGNGLDNRITGNSAANILSGLGGDDKLVGGGGADTMRGGTGDDTYVVDHTGDVVSEASGGVFDDGGNDMVWTSVSYVLPAFVENMTLIGSNAINGTGNELDNRICGNSAANTLIGLGGADILTGNQGADLMYGGAGNDTYVVDDTGDVASEQTVNGVDDGGVDRVNAGVSFTLSAFIENMTLTGTGNINATGNSASGGFNGVNTLVGNSGDNVLRGLGGNDALVGGAGADTFFFSAAAVNGTDRLTDFVSGTDKLQFAIADYAGLTAGTLSPSLYALNAASGPTAQFVYNPATHVLYWDSNGGTAGGITAIAVFTNDAQPVLGDFWVV